MPYKNKERRIKHYQEHKEERKLRRRLYKYGLTFEKTTAILIEQEQKCALCGKFLKEIKICIDHDHTTGKVRGILCSKCNAGLGYFQYFKDNPELFLKVNLYLENEL